MKNILLRHNRRISLAVVVVFSVLLLGSATVASAGNGHGNGNNNWNGNGNTHHYQNGYYNRGYYNRGHAYPYTYYNNQRGYWNQNSSGIRFFIVVN